MTHPNEDTMSGHTALIVGTPWFCVVADEVVGKDADGEVFVVAQLNPLQEMPDEVSAHHARLIAAAPDLLAGAELIVAAFDLCADPVNAIAKLRAAISKATGATHER